MARKTAANSLTTLFLLTGVCAILFAMGSIPLRDPHAVRSMKWSDVFTWGPVLLLTLSGPLIGYIRFDRAREIVWGGILGLVLGILLAPLAAMDDDGHAEVAVSSIVGIIGLLAFQFFIRFSRRKK